MYEQYKLLTQKHNYYLNHQPVIKKLDNFRLTIQKIK